MFSLSLHCPFLLQLWKVAPGILHHATAVIREVSAAARTLRKSSQHPGPLSLSAKWMPPLFPRPPLPPRTRVQRCPGPTPNADPRPRRCRRVGQPGLSAWGFASSYLVACSAASCRVRRHTCFMTRCTLGTHLLLARTTYFPVIIWVHLCEVRMRRLLRGVRHDSVRAPTGPMRQPARRASSRASACGRVAAVALASSLPVIGCPCPISAHAMTCYPQHLAAELTRGRKRTMLLQEIPTEALCLLSAVACNDIGNQQAEQSTHRC